MNERIKDIVSHADLSTYNDLDDTYIAHMNELEKFAELIVRECAKVLWDSNDILGEYRIKKHFGVE